jgi:hypothetical protein
MNDCASKRRVFFAFTLLATLGSWPAVSSGSRAPMSKGGLSGAEGSIGSRPPCEALQDTESFEKKKVLRRTAALAGKEADRKEAVLLPETSLPGVSARPAKASTGSLLLPGTHISRGSVNPAPRSRPRSHGAMFGLHAPLGPLFGQRFGAGSSGPAASGPGWIAARAQSQQTQNEKNKPKLPKSCESDDDCPNGYYCSAKLCRKVKSRINIAYLFYLSGNRRFLSVLGLYMHKLGKKKGFRMVFPFYWHFWSRQKKSRVVFPFYWRFYAAKQKRTDTFVGPFHHWRSKSGSGFNFWPFLFYADYGKKGSRFSFFPFGHYERKGKYSGYGFLTPIGFYFGSKSPKHRTWAMVPWAVGTATPKKALTWVFPLNFYWRRNRSRNWLFFPAAYAHRSPAKHRTFVFPLVWVWGTHKTTNAIGFPLVWHFSRPDRSFTLVPPFFHYRKDQSYVGGAAPVLFYGRDRKAGSFHVTLAPLFHYSSSQRGNVTRFFSPLFMWKSNKKLRSRWWAWMAPPIISMRSLGKGTDVVFPLYWRHFDKARGSELVCVPPFLYYRDHFQRNTFLFPFWWSFRHRDTGAYVRALFPLFYQQRSTTGRTTTVAGPGYLTYGGKKGWHAGLAPLLFFGASKKKHHAVVFPLFWHFKDRESESQTTVAGPFYWATRKKSWHAGLAPLFYLGGGKTTSYQVAFPLLWHFHNRKEKWHTAVAGPLYAHWGKQGWQAGLAPFLFFGAKQGRAHHIVAPLFAHWADRNKGHRTVIAGPGYYWRRKQSWGWGIAPLAFFRRDYDEKGYVSSKLTVLPLFHLARNPKREMLITPLGGYLDRKDKKTMTGVIGPVVWHRSPRYSGWSVLPWLFRWTNRKSKVTTTIAFPFVAQSSPTSSATVVFPFLWRFKDPKQRSLVVFPFYWRLRQKEGWRADVVFPLYWDLAKKDRRFFMAGPYYSYDSEHTRQKGVWPLFHYRRDKEGKKTWVHFFPLFWYNRDDVKNTRWMAAGPYYSSTSPTRAHNGIVPLVFWGHRGPSKYRIGFPLYWDFQNTKEKKRVTFVGPFFYHRNKTEKGGGLLPLLWYRSDPAGMTQLTLAPFFHYKKDPTTFTFYTLLGGWSASPAEGKHHGWAGPYVWVSSPEKRYDIFFPLFWRFKNRATKTTTTFIPPLLYWGKHSPDGKFDLVFPFVWLNRKVTGKTLVVFPFWWDSHDYYKSRTTAVFPLFYRKREYPKDKTTWLFPPGVWVETSPKETSVVVFPLVWHFSKKKEAATKSSTVVFPLYWDFKRTNRRTTIVFPFVWYFDRPNTKTLVVLNTYYRKDKRDGTYRLFCIPFFDFGAPRPGDFRLSILGGMFGYERVGRNRYLKMFFFPIELSPLPRKKGRKGGQKAPARKSRVAPRRDRRPPRLAPVPEGASAWTTTGWSPL